MPRWGNEDFPAPDPYEEVCLSAEQHDVGMAEGSRRSSVAPLDRAAHRLRRRTGDGLAGERLV